MDVDKIYWVVDVEGNGAMPPEIVELAMVEVNDFTLTGNSRHWFLRPDQPITPAVTRIHGITNADVANAPSMEDIADDLLLWLGQFPIAGHNVRVELDALSRAIPEWHPRQAIDTLKLAKILRPGLPSYGLEKLGQALGQAQEARRLCGTTHHSALYDATLAGLLFVDLLSSLPVEPRAAALHACDILDRPQGALL
jgi:DNA polymerase III epsilon subunit-like protein